MGKRGVQLPSNYTHNIDYPESKHTWQNCQRFIECLPVPGGHHADGQRTLKLLDWQIKILKGIWPENKPNRTEVLISVARRNGKTVFLAGIMSFLLFNKHKKSTPLRGSRFVSAACSQDQAKLVFNLIVGWCISVRQLGEDSNIKSDLAQIEVLSSPGTLFVSVPAQARAVLGGNFAAVFADECGFWRSNELMTALREGLASVPRERRLFLSASTVPSEREHFFYEQIAESLAKGNTKNRYSYLALGHTDDNISNPKVHKQAIKKANPSFGHLLYQESFDESYEQAIDFPQRMAAYRAYRLNQPVEVVDTTHLQLVTKQAFEACRGETKLVNGEDVVVSWDCSSTHDLTCILVASVAKPHRVHAEFIIPKATADINKGHVPWALWEQQKHCSIEKRPSISKQRIIDRYAEICEQYNVVASSSDRWGYPEIIQIADTEGVNLDRHRPSKMNLEAQDTSLKALKDLISNKQLLWSNPILAFCMNHVRLYVARTGAVMIDRKLSHKNHGRVDGAVCLALTALLLNDKECLQPSNFDLRGLL